MAKKDEEVQRPGVINIGPLGGGGTGLVNLPTEFYAAQSPQPASSQAAVDRIIRKVLGEPSLPGQSVGVVDRPQYLPGSQGERRIAMDDRARAIVAARGATGSSALRPISAYRDFGPQWRGQFGPESAAQNAGLNAGSNQGNLGADMQRPIGPGGTTPLYRPGAVAITDVFKPDYNYMNAQRGAKMITSAAEQEFKARQNKFGTLMPPDPIFISRDHRDAYSRAKEAGVKAKGALDLANIEVANEETRAIQNTRFDDTLRDNALIAEERKTQGLPPLPESNYNVHTINSTRGSTDNKGVYQAPTEEELNREQTVQIIRGTTPSAITFGGAVPEDRFSPSGLAYGTEYTPADLKALAAEGPKQTRALELEKEKGSQNVRQVQAGKKTPAERKEERKYAQEDVAVAEAIRGNTALIKTYEDRLAAADTEYSKMEEEHIATLDPTPFEETNTGQSILKRRQRYQGMLDNLLGAKSDEQLSFEEARAAAAAKKAAQKK